jgi:hypothetical protein
VLLLLEAFSLRMAPSAAELLALLSLSSISMQSARLRLFDATVSGERVTLLTGELGFAIALALPPVPSSIGSNASGFV